ncbi:maleylpyruvate isomerase family mycothiol-dependent enzyme [Streptomyces galilaeus]|uniref:maleylpyruvate isomerase family mycothiol-dependent enzyme n=1 Tax=Streptomyces galilaeus TaxID=33899 RepID=UPI0038F7626A
MSAERVVDALLEEWSAIDVLLSGATRAQWQLPSPCPGWSVHDLASHIIGAEAAAAWEGSQTASTRSALIALAQPECPDSNDAWVRMLRTERPREVLRRLRTVIPIRETQLRSLTGEQLARQVPTPAGPRSYARYLQIRVFDCWMHEQDMRDALGRPGHDDGAPAELAVDEITETIGYLVAKRAQVPDGTTVVFDLQGPVERQIAVEVAGGRGRVVDPATGQATVTLQTRSNTLTRICGGRVTTEEAMRSVTIFGDRHLGTRIVGALPYTP